MIDYWATIRHMAASIQAPSWPPLNHTTHTPSLPAGFLDGGQTPYQPQGSKSYGMAGQDMSLAKLLRDTARKWAGAGGSLGGCLVSGHLGLS